ncbi:hypothetical protein KPL71_001820 [Citrus sinensis]|uniref:Uncharacterized protein n=1 Tax=Citrus sinensis TaxID=2711 RepID=A0ACB8P0G4_CITSI|nr:hypothetical protein KPL71_001820 [Citrus sinensis]
MSVGVALLFLHFLVISTINNNINFCNGSSYAAAGCIESEREALLSFKQDLEDPSNRLASWNNIGVGDCCKWYGVVCDNITGHVLELRLRNPSRDDGSPAEYEAYERSKIVGKINPSLLGLKHLIHLDLSYNDFQGIQIPRFLGSLENLMYLNISRAGFVGIIPHQIGNLSNLQFLDLRPNYLGGLYVEDFGWVSHLSLLKHLDLSGVDLSKTSDGPLITNSLHSLETLRFSGCLLHHISPLSFANFSSLVTLDISDNQFADSSIVNQVLGLVNLVFLDLSTNNFQGAVPDAIQNSTSLQHLDLSRNHFSSSVPDWFNKFIDLEYLSLSYNELQGSIPGSLGNLTSIKSLDLSFNRLESKIPRAFKRLRHLRSVNLSGNKLSQEISQVLDMFSACASNVLESLDLSNNTLFGLLTNQIGNFKNLDSLDLSFNNISGHIPLSLGQLSSLRYLDVSTNNLNGTLSENHFANLTKLVGFDASGNSLVLKVVSPSWTPPFQLQAIGLSSCFIGPQFPQWLLSQNHLIYLDLSNSSISDTIPDRLVKSLSQINYLNLSYNQIFGQIPDLNDAAQLETLDLSSNSLSGPLPLIPSSLTTLDLSSNFLSGTLSRFLCNEMNNSMRLQVLNLGNNTLSGEIPDCWMNWSFLFFLHLGENDFTGNLPTSLGTLSSLQILHLRGNRFSGKIPVSLQNCTELRLFDISENEFVGNIPTWIGERLSGIILLSLRANQFHGFFPPELCGLASLKILDLSSNNLTGVIPRCINNLAGMAKEVLEVDKFFEDALIVYKKKVVKYPIGYPYYLKVLDLSANYFSGEIPSQVTNLVGLQTLKLSHNFFSGRIPVNMGAMKSVEALDFSSNRLQGEIPKNMVNLEFLEIFNISYNNLSGEVPPAQGQFATFDSDSYIGNEYLCGLPLRKLCAGNVSTPVYERGSGGKHELSWLNVSLLLGVILLIFGV